MKKFININNNRLKTFTKVSLVALALTTVTSACKKDFLTKVPELSLSDVNAYDTPDRVKAIVNGLYLNVRSGGLFGGRYHIYNDIRGEDFNIRVPNGVTGSTVYNFTNNSSDTYTGNFWSIGYLAINRVNIFLDGLEQNKTKLPANLYENYKAEAKFLRALTYFGLVQVFAKPYVSDGGASRGLPLRLLPEQDTQHNVLKSSSVKEIYTQILKDLTDARDNLPDNYSTAILNTTRAHKNTAIALLTRVYLAMGDYPNTLAEGNKLVPASAPFTNTARVAHALQANVKNVFTAPYTTSESIFSFAFDVTNAPGTQNQLGYYFNAGNLEYFLKTTGNAIYVDPAWPASDARKSQLTSTYAGIGPHPIKYSAVSPYLDFVPMIRYADVMLMVAEAEASRPGGDLARSRALLDAVRHRSDPAYDFGVLASGAALEAAILKERRIEFLAEGFRFTDIARKAAPVSSAGAGTTIPVTDERYNYPIPDAEVLFNPQVKW